MTDFEKQYKGCISFIDQLIQENKTLLGLLKSKDQEIKMLVGVMSDADQLTEALGRAAPNRLKPEYHLPEPNEYIKDEWHQWLKSTTFVTQQG